MENELCILQRSKSDLNNVGTIMTEGEWQRIPARPPWFPTVIPDTSWEESALLKKGIRVEKLNIATMSVEEQKTELAKLAICYADVFADPNTWDEKTRCPIEDKFYGSTTEVGQTCSCGQCQLEPAYPIETTVAKITEELTKPNAELYVVRDERTNNIKGFTWSYTTTPIELAKEKWQTAAMRRKVTTVLKQVGITSNQKITYFSESGILPELRGNGISKLFYSKRLESARKRGDAVIVRTNTKSAINVLAEEFGMMQIFGPAVEIQNRRADGKRILVSIDRAYCGVDIENNERVLYALAGLS